MCSVSTDTSPGFTKWGSRLSSLAIPSCNLAKPPLPFSASAVSFPKRGLWARSVLPCLLVTKNIFYRHAGDQSYTRAGFQISTYTNSSAREVSFKSPASSPTPGFVTHETLSCTGVGESPIRKPECSLSQVWGLSDRRRSLETTRRTAAGPGLPCVPDAGAEGHPEREHGECPPARLPCARRERRSRSQARP